MQILKLLFAAGLIYWMIQKGVLDVWGLVGQANFFQILSAFFLVFLILITGNYRWSLLLKAQSLPSKFRETLPLTLIGLFFSFALPGGVSGDIAKCWYLIKGHRGKTLKAISAIALDRFLGLWTMLLLAGFALWSNLELVRTRIEVRNLAAITLLLFFLVTSVLTVLLFPDLLRRSLLSRLLNKILPRKGRYKDLISIWPSIALTYRKSPRALWGAIILSLFSHFLTILFMINIAIMLGAKNVDWMVFLFVIPLGLITTSLPITPAGIGVGQAAFLFLFSVCLNYDSKFGPGLITAFQMVSFIWSLVGGWIYFRKGQKPLTMRPNTVST